MVPEQLLGSHFLEYQQRITNTIETGEATLFQLLIDEVEDNFKRQIKTRTF